VARLPQNKLGKENLGPEGDRALIAMLERSFGRPLHHEFCFRLSQAFVVITEVAQTPHVLQEESPVAR
jgi:hypothetical protein